MIIIIIIQVYCPYASKDYERLLSFHLRMLPYAVTIVYLFGRSRGLRTCIQRCK
jgi:hypothetical protein